MAKALKLLVSASSNILSRNATSASILPKLPGAAANNSFLELISNGGAQTPRAHSTLSAVTYSVKQKKSHLVNLKERQIPVSTFSTEVDKEISKFLEKEIQYEKSRSSDSLPKVPGFDISTDDADVILSKTSGSEKIVVRLTVNGAIDSLVPETQTSQTEEPPQMVCRPPFEVEISKGDGTVLALQCSFPAVDDVVEDAGQQGTEQIDDQFEIQEVAIHGGEWKDTTYSVSAATMDAELFDLLMDMLDERGINDEFIAHLVDYCTAYENQKYVSFLGSLKSFAEK